MRTATLQSADPPAAEDPSAGSVTPDAPAADRQFSINLSRGLMLLRSFTQNDSSLSHRDLCERSGLPKATVSRLIYTLSMLGYMSRTADQRYALGAGVLQLSYPMLAGMRMRQIARPWLERLATETGGSANLGVCDRLDVVYVDSCRTDRSNAFAPDIGSSRPLLVCAIGRALLSGSSPKEQAALLNRLRLADPERFVADAEIWEREREAYARRGYFWSQGDWRPGINAIAVPLRQSLQVETMAINCTWTVEPGSRSESEPTARVALLKEAARRIEQAARQER